MISASDFVSQFELSGVNFFAGVPDSLLKSFCAYVESALAPGRHIITANEGNAVALCIGNYLATGSAGLVYLQNSGLGNIVNPITSLADPEVYSIPICILIGWRGEPGVEDEPQHVKQGRITEQQLKTLELPYWVLDAHCDWKARVSDALNVMHEQMRPVALLVRGGTFDDVKAAFPNDPRYVMKREDAIKKVLSRLTEDDLVVASTGHISREVYEHRIQTGQGTGKDFLTVGGMGHTASLALGLALGQPGRRVVCLDGDGSLLMHMGMLPIIGTLSPSNLVHILINNGAHDSVGGQPTVAFDCDFPAIGRASGYRAAWTVWDQQGIEAALTEAFDTRGPVLVEIRVAKGARKDLGRPKTTPLRNRQDLMNALSVLRP